MTYSILETIKWIGTACVIAAAGVRGFGLNEIDIVLSILGGIFWTTAAIAMKDKPLFVVNFFVIAAIFFGFFLK